MCIRDRDRTGNVTNPWSEEKEDNKITLKNNKTSAYYIITGINNNCSKKFCNYEKLLSYTPVPY